MSNKITKQEIIENLSGQYADYISELYDEDVNMVSKEEIDNLQNQIRGLVKDHGNKVRLVVKIKLRKGYMVKNLGENYYRKARFIEDVLKNGIEIPSDATYFELTICPAILAKNIQKNKVEAKVLNQDLLKTTVYMGESTKDYEKVSTGKGEYHKLSQDNPNEFVWNNFTTRLISVKGVENTI